MAISQIQMGNDSNIDFNGVGKVYQIPTKASVASKCINISTTNKLNTTKGK